MVIKSSILKFKSEVKTAGNIEIEETFRSKLDETFEIRQASGGRQVAESCESMEIENSVGTFFSKLEFHVFLMEYIP